MCCSILVVKKCIHQHNYSIYIMYTGGERWHFSSYLKDYGGIGSAKLVYFGDWLDALTGPLPAWRYATPRVASKIDQPIFCGAQRRDASGTLLAVTRHVWWDSTYWLDCERLLWTAAVNGRRNAAQTDPVESSSTHKGAVTHAAVFAWLCL